MKLWVMILGLGISLFPGFDGVFSQPSIDYLGLKNKAVTTIGVNYGILAAGTDRHGVYWYNDLLTGDTTWNFIGLDSAEVYTVYPHKSGPLGWAIGAGIRPDSAYLDYVYCSFLGGPFESRDSGISDTVATLIHELDGFPDPSVCGETYAAAGGALYRRNFGDSVWVPLYIATVEGYVQTVKVNEEYPGVVMAGGAEGFAGILLLKSLDYGLNWEWLTPPGFVTDIDFCGDTADTIFVMAGHAYRSVDNGQSWTEIFNTSWISITGVLYEPTSGILYIAGSDGLLMGNAVVFYSRDLGNSWEMLLLNTDEPIIDLGRDQAGWIYFATRNSGVYRFDPSTVVEINPSQNSQTMTGFRLEQNYPNPFNSGTRLTFWVPFPSHVQLEIFDLQGRRIRNLFDAQLPIGQQQIGWDGILDSGKMAASGTYFCRLKAGEQTRSIRMLLLR